jgi:hypothetical protein
MIISLFFITHYDDFVLAEILSEIKFHARFQLLTIKGCGVFITLKNYQGA